MLKTTDGECYIFEAKNNLILWYNSDQVSRNIHGMIHNGELKYSAEIFCAYMSWYEHLQK